MAKQVEDFDSNLAGEEGKESTRTSWFKRIRKGILTGTHEKKETPEGLWTKCPECNFICTSNELKENLFVCPKCSYHHRIGSEEYYSILFDDNEYKELFENILSKDYLEFTDLKPYKKRLEEIWSKTDLKDSMRVAVGKVSGNVRTRELLQLRGECVVSGNIYAGKLQVEPTATFNGQCHMGANVVEMGNGNEQQAAFK